MNAIALHIIGIVPTVALTDDVEGGGVCHQFTLTGAEGTHAFAILVIDDVPRGGVLNVGNLLRHSLHGIEESQQKK